MKIVAGITLFVTVLSAGFAKGTEPEPFAVVRTQGILILDFSRATRGAGMGATGVADPSSSANMIYNPANIIGETGATAFYQHDDFLNLFSVHDVGLSWGQSIGGDSYQYTVGLRHTRLSYDAPAPRVVFLPEGTGEGLDIDDHVTVLAVAGAIRRDLFQWSFGAAVKSAHLQIASEGVDGWVVDLGMRLGWEWEDQAGNGYELGVGASTTGNSTGFDVVRARKQFRVGVMALVAPAYRVTHPLSGREVRTVSFRVNTDMTDTDSAARGVGAGVEVGVAETLFLRTGAVNDTPGYANGVTWGVGLALDFAAVRVRLDVAGYPMAAFLNDTDNTIYGIAVDYLLASSSQ